MNSGKKQRPKRGRPPAADPLDDQVRIRCKTPEKAAWFAAAGGKQAFSAWARAVLNAASR